MKGMPLKHGLSTYYNVKTFFDAFPSGFQLFKQTVGGVAMKASSFAQPVVERMVEEEPVFAAERAVETATDAAMAAAPEAVNMVPPPPVEVATTTPWLAITLWVVIGILFILSVYFLIKRFKKK